MLHRGENRVKGDDNCEDISWNCYVFSLSTHYSFTTMIMFFVVSTSNPRSGHGHGNTDNQW